MVRRMSLSRDSSWQGCIFIIPGKSLTGLDGTPSCRSRHNFRFDQKKILSSALPATDYPSMFRWLIIFAPTIAEALTGTSNGSSRLVTSFDALPQSSEEIILSEEIIDLGDKHKSKLKLQSSQSLLGQYGISAKKAVAKLAPHLQNCQIQLASLRTSSNHNNVHEQYHLRFGIFRLHDAWLNLHHTHNRLTTLRAKLPAFKLPADVYTEADFLSAEQLGLLDASILASAHSERVIAEVGDQATPAWEISYLNQETGQTQIWLFDAQTGAKLNYESIAFDLDTVSVYERSPSDGKLIQVKLDALKPTGYLDSEVFSVYAPTATAPRARAPFLFATDDATQALEFDQVQVYYSTNRALHWLRQKFSYDTQKVSGLTLRINEIAAGSRENSQYVPPPHGPAILIGAGGPSLANLARDGDVVTHELMHHVIYEFLRSHRGEAGIIHEGTADYFVYALNNDPNLARATRRTGEPLRTAALPAQTRYDTFRADRSAHQLGQIWSALLWDLRLELGDMVDQMVFEGLAYLGPQSGLRDALISLLSADASLFEGRHRCNIFEAAIKRGFGLAMAELDGSACGLDLKAISLESRQLLQSQKAQTEISVKPQEERLRERLCGTIGHDQTQQARSSLIPLVMLLLGLLPWVKTWISKKS